MISSALYRFFGMVQISSVGFLPLSIWTKKLGLGQTASSSQSRRAAEQASKSSKLTARISLLPPGATWKATQTVCAFMLSRIAGVACPAKLSSGKIAMREIKIVTVTMGAVAAALAIAAFVLEVEAKSTHRCRCQSRLRSAASPPSPSNGRGRRSPLPAGSRCRTRCSRSSCSRDRDPGTGTHRSGD